MTKTKSIGLLVGAIAGLLIAATFAVQGVETPTRNFQTVASGNVSGQSSSVDSEIALFSGTGGKTIKRATGTGAVSVASGVYTAGTLTVANGGTNLTASADDNVMIGNGTTWETKAIPNCTDTGGNHLNYTASSNTLSCGTSTSGGSGTATVRIAHKTADTSRASTTTLTDDPDIAWTSLASGNYHLTCLLRVLNAGSATPDFKFQITISNAVSNQAYNVHYTGDTGAVQMDQGVNLSTSPSTLAVANGGLGIFATLNYWFTIGSTSNVALQWAQQTSDVNATVLKAGTGCNLVSG